jgi:hypothetical protein
MKTRVTLVEHDLIGKPVSTFPDHALTTDAQTYSIFDGGTATAKARPLNRA